LRVRGNLTMSNNGNNNTANSESVYKSLFIKDKEIMLLINPQTSEIKDCNLEACYFYGYPYDEMVKMKITDFNIITKEQVGKEMNLAKDEQRNRSCFKHRLLDGQVSDVEVHSTPINIEGKTLLFSIIADTTNNLLSSILESSPEIIVFTFDRNYCYLAFNIKHKNTMKAIWGKEMSGQKKLMK
jgi:PAS domain S-box-containing protein